MPLVFAPHTQQTVLLVPCPRPPRMIAVMPSLPSRSRWTAFWTPARCPLP